MLLFAGESLGTMVEGDRDRSLRAIASIQRAGTAGRGGPEALARRFAIRPPTLYVGSESVDVACREDGRTIEVRFVIPFDGDPGYLHASHGPPVDDDAVEVDGMAVTLSYRMPTSAVGRDAAASARDLLGRHDDVLDGIVGRLGSQSAAVDAANADIARAVSVLFGREARALALAGGLASVMSGRGTAVVGERTVEGFDDEEAEVPRRLAHAGR